MMLFAPIAMELIMGDSLLDSMSSRIGLTEV
jgi:hypothetical protein